MHKRIRKERKKEEEERREGDGDQEVRCLRTASQHHTAPQTTLRGSGVSSQPLPALAIAEAAENAQDAGGGAGTAVMRAS